LSHATSWSYEDVEEYNIDLEGKDVVVVGASIFEETMVHLIIKCTVQYAFFPRI